MKKIKIASALFLLSLGLIFSCSENNHKIDDLFTYAKTRSDDLKLSVYIVSWEIESLLTTDAGRREAVSIIRCNGITKVILETYRDGISVDKALLIKLRDFFQKNGIEVIGGIALRPGKDFGVLQDGPLGWLNWQNPKTERDVKEKIEMSASIFDELMVDDFLCTSDTSLESKTAKGDRSWSEYRRDLLSEFSDNIIIGPAKKINPNIKVIIKFPQWYDRFHLFGYDPEREPLLYDKVWIGTETRGQYTQRYGFVQPYEGFISYRWMKDIAGSKLGGGWFDHGDCDKTDFIEQAYQTVAAGAKEIILFSYGVFAQGHEGHHLLRTQFHQLADLAKHVNTNPVEGISGYKPIHSGAGGDLYIMDFIGSLGIPIIPCHRYPQNAPVVFLPTQAAADKKILSKIEKSLSNNTTIIFTTGFLANAADGKKLAALAGIKYPITTAPITANSILVDGNFENISIGLDLEASIQIVNGKSLLKAKVGENSIPFLVKSNQTNANIFTLNSHTFSQEDFDKVGEVLLCPKPSGLLEIPKKWANTIRNIFTSKLNFELNAATRISVQPTGKAGWIFHNYNKTTQNISLVKQNLGEKKVLNGFTGKVLNTDNDTLNLRLEPRSRMWVKIEME